MKSEAVDIPFIPLHDKVVVKEFDAPNKTSGGVLLPDTVKKWPARGIILAISEDIPLEYAKEGQECPFEVGNEIVYDKYSGTSVLFEEVSYLFLPYTDIRGIVKKKEHAE